MTHTNHRYGTEEDLANDYVVLIMPAKGINNQGAAPKLRELFDVLAAHQPINGGGIDIGTLLTSSVAEIRRQISDSTPMIHAVYDNLDTVAAVVDEIKAKNFGFSVVVSGLLNRVDQAETTHGIQRHSVEYSLGVLGKTELLPPDSIRKITTMCGHGLISRHLVAKVLFDLQARRTTLHEAALELGRCCVCGVFNVKRAEQLLQEALQAD
ncbi:MAG TPA: hypothetical protein GXX50_05940 [Firmicutes bacterium]|nr:hypothetical protein [Bacillota bacterium]